MNIQRHTPVSATNPAQAVQAPVKKADPREVVATANDVSAKTPVEKAPTSPGHPRLEAFSKKIEARFENALSAEGLSPRQQQALEKERDRFHSMIARFEAAYMDGAESGKMDKSNGMQKLLADFAKTVNHIVAGGESGVPTDKKVMDAPTAMSHRAAKPGRDGINVVG